MSGSGEQFSDKYGFKAKLVETSLRDQIASAVGNLLRSLLAGVCWFFICSAFDHFLGPRKSIWVNATLFTCFSLMALEAAIRPPYMNRYFQMRGKSSFLSLAFLPMQLAAFSVLLADYSAIRPGLFSGLGPHYKPIQFLTYGLERYLDTLTFGVFDSYELRMSHLRLNYEFWLATTVFALKLPISLRLIEGIIATYNAVQGRTLYREYVEVPPEDQPGKKHLRTWIERG